MSARGRRFDTLSPWWYCALQKFCAHRWSGPKACRFLGHVEDFCADALRGGATAATADPSLFPLVLFFASSCPLCLLADIPKPWICWRFPKSQICGHSDVSLLPICLGYAFLTRFQRRVKVCEVVPGLDLSGPSTVWSVVAGFSPLPWCLVRGKSLNQFQVRLRWFRPAGCASDLLLLGDVRLKPQQCVKLLGLSWRVESSMLRRQRPGKNLLSLSSHPLGHGTWCLPLRH
ncbi:hypothetical protein Bca4012_037220 [Brassica carinata]